MVILQGLLAISIVGALGAILFWKGKRRRSFIAFLVLLFVFLKLDSYREQNDPDYARQNAARRETERAAHVVSEMAAATKENAAKEAALQKNVACREDLQCWGDKHSIGAAIRCRAPVEKLAKYSFEWTDGWLEPKFSRFRWASKSAGTVTYVGDKIKFQNGFGAFQFYTYFCDYDPDHEVVLDVRAVPGRLP